MGWSNYIIIQKLKLIVETNRNINELYDYQKKALDYLTDEERLFDIDEEREVGEIYIKNLSVKDLTVLFNIYEQASKISEMEPDRFFLYWLESRGLKYEIKSEFESTSDELDNLRNEGYVILRIYDNEDK